MSDQEIWNLKRGGHDYRKVYAAYRAAMEHKGQPTVILAKTIKGYTLGKHFEGRNATHQMKKLALEDLKDFRDSQRIPITDAAAGGEPVPAAVLPPRPGRPGDPLHARPAPRAGRLPAGAPHQVQGADAARPRHLQGAQEGLRATRRSPPPWRPCAPSRNCCGTRRSARASCRSSPTRPARSAWTRGSRRLKIYNRNGQLYTSVDAELMLAYKESEIGQILHEGINEAGSTASFTAVGTSYATHNEPMIPIYIFYSMFGFQRTGDGFWAAADQMARGFVLGATAGRTTLTGEGLQHADGHSLLLAATNPAVVAYDPAFAYEIAYIVESGLRRMYGENPENIFFYMTIYNEPYVQPAEPEDLDVEGLLRGHLPLPAGHRRSATNIAQILASGRGHARGAARRRPAGRRVGRRRRRVVGDQLGRAQPRRRRDREGSAAPPRAPGAGTPYVTTALADAAGPGGGGVGLDARGARADPAVGARHLHHAGHRRVRLLRHPARPRAATSTPTPSRSWSRCSRPSPATATSTSRWRSRPPRKYQIDDVHGGRCVLGHRKRRDQRHRLLEDSTRKMA